jgi:hypothetical protein
MTEKLDRPSYDELPVLEGTSLRTAWGQYGETDELGAVNLLTAERVRAAAYSVITGERFSLGLPLHMPDPPIYGREPFQHKVYTTMPNITDDRLDSFFPQGSSQWDALAHFAHPTKGFYNGFTMADVLDFEALADACAADGRYDFLLASAPLWVQGGVGSPLNAIAIR